MPRQFANLGDKLAFSNGIVALSLGAATLIIVFGGDQHRLIPLYMIGVFLSFTLSQSSMFLRTTRMREPGWQLSAAISGFGALLTFLVLIIVMLTKTLDGAWIVIALIPILVTVFKLTRTHYESVAEQLSLANVEVDTTPHGHIVIVPIGGVHRAVIEALRYASALAKDVRAVYVNVNPESLVQLKKDWPMWGSHVKLVVLQSPYRSMTEPLLDYIDRMEKEHPDDYITVVLPEFVVKHWWHHLLHNQSALTLKAALLFRPRVVTTSVPFHLTSSSRTLRSRFGYCGGRSPAAGFAFGSTASSFSRFKRGVEQRQLLRQRLLHLRELRVELRRQLVEHLDALIGRLVVGAFDHAGQRRDLVVQLDRIVERILAAAVADLVGLFLHRCQRHQHRVGQLLDLVLAARPTTFCSRWLICSRRLRMSITAWLASLTLSRTRTDSLNCSSRSASVMPSATEPRIDARR